MGYHVVQLPVDDVGPQRPIRDIITPPPSDSALSGRLRHHNPLALRPTQIHNGTALVALDIKGRYALVLDQQFSLPALRAPFALTAAASHGSA